eukprot:m.30277 g.30277  ORF g.30277 m.30277 type:complete len:137 (-) comp16249_c0_seq1:347-757(-)
MNTTMLKTLAFLALSLICSPTQTLAEEDTSLVMNSRFNRKGYGEDLVGKRITVFCTEWENWYAADVLRFHEETNSHELEYVLDGWQEVADLTNFHVKILEGDDDDSYTHGEPPSEFLAKSGSLLETFSSLLGFSSN